MRLRLAVPPVLLVAALLVPPAVIAETAQPRKANQNHWPEFDTKPKKRLGGSVTYYGTEKNDELLGRHGSDTLKGRGGSDVLWGDWDPSGQPGSQRDRIDGGAGTDFIYSSHGHNAIKGGAGNDAISGHYGYGTIDCGPGRDVYHVPKTRKGKWKVKRCETVDRRSEKQRGGGLKPLK